MLSLLLLCSILCMVSADYSVESDYTTWRQFQSDLTEDKMMQVRYIQLIYNEYLSMRNKTVLEELRKVMATRTVPHQINTKPATVPIHATTICKCLNKSTVNKDDSMDLSLSQFPLRTALRYRTFRIDNNEHFWSAKLDGSKKGGYFVVVETDWQLNTYSSGFIPCRVKAVFPKPNARAKVVEFQMTCEACHEEHKLCSDK